EDGIRDYKVTGVQTCALPILADPIKESTAEAISLLHREGIRIVMVTGDSRTTAEAVGNKLGIDEVIAEVLPGEKGEIVKRLQVEDRKSTRLNSSHLVISYAVF